MRHLLLGTDSPRAHSRPIRGAMNREPAGQCDDKGRLLTNRTRLHFKASRRIPQNLIGQRVTQDGEQGGFMCTHLIEQVWMLASDSGWPEPQAIVTLKHEPEAGVSEALTDGESLSVGRHAGASCLALELRASVTGIASL